jgi:hypothetical protein
LLLLCCYCTGAGVLFGNTGGVMEAAVRTVYEVVTGKVRLGAVLWNAEATAAMLHG